MTQRLNPTDRLIRYRQSICRVFFNVGLPLLFCFSLSSCGFELRGLAKPPMSLSLTQINLDCPISKSWQLCQQLRKHFLQNNIALSPESIFTLSLSSIEEDQRTLSLQDNSSAAEFGLSYQVEFEFFKHLANKNSTPQSLIKHIVTVNQSYRHESTALLAKERERNEVQKQLSQRLADEIFRQVSLFDLDGNP